MLDQDTIARKAILLASEMMLNNAKYESGNQPYDAWLVSNDQLSEALDKLIARQLDLDTLG